MFFSFPSAFSDIRPIKSKSASFHIFYIIITPFILFVNTFLSKYSGKYGFFLLLKIHLFIRDYSKL